MISQNNLKGFVFYSFIQSCYDKKIITSSLIEQAIKKKYEIYFAREKNNFKKYFRI